MNLGFVSNIKGYAKKILFFALAFLSKPIHLVNKNKNKVLLVRTDAIGDFVLWLDAARGLRHLYPMGKYQLCLLGNSLWSSLAEETRLFDRVLSLDKKAYVDRISYRVLVILKIRCMGFGKVINPTYSRTAMTDFIVKMSGASERIGYDGDSVNISKNDKALGDRWYTNLIPAETRQGMELIRNAAFVRGLGLNDFRAELPVLTCGQSSLGVKDYFVVVPGAGWRRRQWPVQRFAEVIEKIHSSTGLCAVVCGGSGEEILGQYITDNSSHPVLDLVGRTSLGNLVSIIRGAKLLIGNETGSIHIAAAVSTPSICILGGGHFGRFVPYQVEAGRSGPLPVAVWSNKDCFGCNWLCKYRSIGDERSVPCVDEITTEAVFAEICRLLNLNICNAFDDAERV